MKFEARKLSFKCNAVFRNRLSLCELVKESGWLQYVPQVYVPTLLPGELYGSHEGMEVKAQCWQEDDLLGLAASIFIHYNIWLALELSFLVGNSLGVRWVDFLKTQVLMKIQNPYTNFLLSCTSEKTMWTSQAHR